jgi:hypothetical protein
MMITLLTKFLLGGATSSVVRTIGAAGIAKAIVKTAITDEPENPIPPVYVPSPIDDHATFGGQ